MFTVPPLSPTELDQWPLATAGLPHRATRVLTEHNLQTVGEIRVLSTDGLRSVTGLGKATRKAIDDYLLLCQKVIDGTLQFESLPALLKQFLLPAEIDILLRRYGLLRPDTASSRSFMRLQEIANEFGLTRERVRQIERTALQEMRGRLQQQCLSPLYREICTILSEQEGILRCDATERLDTLSWMGGYKASSVLLLLHDINPNPYTYYRDTFSLFHIDELHNVEQWVLRALHGLEYPISATELLKRFYSEAGGALLPRQNGGDCPPWTATALGIFASSLPHVIATQDQHFLITDAALRALILDILRPLSKSVHYRWITEALNARFQKHCRIGPRRIMLILHRDPAFIQIRSGYYAIASDS